VILGIEALRESPPSKWPDVLAGLARSKAPVFSYLAEEVFAHRSARVREVIRRVALLDDFTPEPCDAVCVPGSRAIIKDLAGQGLFIERRQDGSFALRPLIRDYALEQLPLPAAQAREVRVAAAGWHAGAGHIAAAVSLLLAAEIPDRLVPLLADHGQWLLSTGHVALVVDACRALPPRAAQRRDPPARGRSPPGPG